MKISNRSSAGRNFRASYSASLFTVVSLAVFCAGCSTDVFQPDKIASFESQNRILREQNSILKGEVSEHEAREQKLAARLTQAETELAQQQDRSQSRR
jgi:hypothetical protein